MPSNEPKGSSVHIDQGCIPYGDHAAYPSDDSNGKNTGVAFSLKLLEIIMVQNTLP